MPKRKKVTKTGRKLVKQAKANIKKLELELSEVKKDVEAMMSHVHNTPPTYSMCPPGR
jgi:hypothetical protein